MSGKSINFDNKKTNKSSFYGNKKLFNIDDIDVNKILISKREPYGTKHLLKYFIGHNDNDAIRPLCIKFPQMIGYVKCLTVMKQCLLRLFLRNCYKSTPKYGKKLAV